MRLMRVSVPGEKAAGAGNVAVKKYGMGGAVKYG